MAEPEPEYEPDDRDARFIWEPGDISFLDPDDPRATIPEPDVKANAGEPAEPRHPPGATSRKAEARDRTRWPGRGRWSWIASIATQGLARLPTWIPGRERRDAPGSTPGAFLASRPRDARFIAAST